MFFFKKEAEAAVSPLEKGSRYSPKKATPPFARYVYRTRTLFSVGETTKAEMSVGTSLRSLAFAASSVYRLGGDHLSPPASNRKASKPSSVAKFLR